MGKTQKERREYSDLKIITSAIQCFGQNGYTYTTLGNIGKKAGVSAGLISQRYESKENLFIATYLHVMRMRLQDVPIEMTPRQCLIEILDDIIKMSEEKPDEFHFLCMLQKSTDIPMAKIKENTSFFKNSNIYKILSDAQEKGMIPEGNLSGILGSFAGNAYLHIQLCKKYGMKMPEKDFYLEAISFKDQKYTDNLIWHQVLETAFSYFIEVIAYINIDNNTGKMIRCSEGFLPFGNSDDIRKSIQEIINSDVLEADRERIHQFINFDTLSDRLKNKACIHSKYPTRNGNNFTLSLIPICWNHDASLTEIIAMITKENV